MDYFPISIRSGFGELAAGIRGVDDRHREMSPRYQDARYLRDGVGPVFADYVLSEFTAQKFRNSIGDPDLAIWVSENRTGIDGFVTVCSTAAPPLPGAG